VAITAAGVILRNDAGLDPEVLEDFVEQGGGVVSLVGGEFQGFILESFLFVRPVGVAATAGLGIVFLDDWPIPMFNVVKAPLSVKDTEFYTRQFWPDMRELFASRGIP
jgi:hypothetical protein